MEDNFKEIAEESASKGLNDWCKCTTNGVVTKEDKSIQNIMRMKFPLSDPRGTLAKPGKN